MAQEGNSNLTQNEILEDGVSLSTERTYQDIVDLIDGYLVQSLEILEELQEGGVVLEQKVSVIKLKSVSSFLWEGVRHSNPGTLFWYSFHKARRLVEVVVLGIENISADFNSVANLITSDLEYLNSYILEIKREVDRERLDSRQQFFELDPVNLHRYAHELLSEASEEVVRETVLLLLKEREDKRKELSKVTK